MPSKIKGVPFEGKSVSPIGQFIIAVASRSFLQDGYARTTMSGIAATLGGSKSTLWRFFLRKKSCLPPSLTQRTALLDT